MLMSREDCVIKSVFNSDSMLRALGLAVYLERFVQSRVSNPGSMVRAIDFVHERFV